LKGVDLDALSNAASIPVPKLKRMRSGVIKAGADEANRLTASLKVVDGKIVVDLGARQQCDKSEKFRSERTALMERLLSKHPDTDPAVMLAASLASTNMRRPGCLGSDWVSVDGGKIVMVAPEKMIPISVGTKGGTYKQADSADVIPLPESRIVKGDVAKDQPDQVLLEDAGNRDTVDLDRWQAADDELMGITAAKELKKAAIERHKAASKAKGGAHQIKTRPGRPSKAAWEVGQQLAQTAITDDIRAALMNEVITPEPLAVSRPYLVRADAGFKECRDRIKDADLEFSEDGCDPKYQVLMTGRNHLLVPLKPEVEAARRSWHTVEITTRDGTKKDVDWQQFFEHETKLHKRKVMVAAAVKQSRERKRDANVRATQRADARIWFGKHYGTLFSELDEGYLEYLARQRNPEPEVLAELERRGIVIRPDVTDDDAEAYLAELSGIPEMSDADAEAYVAALNALNDPTGSDE
jgi:hypothetical protein